ncbi:MAG: phosphoesterase [Caulobacteraceae bacterium]|nr:phosphoesterase [Caulobacteraceae bacterium]
MLRQLLWTIAAVAAVGAPAGAWSQTVTQADRAVPKYAHVIVIVEENKNYAQIMDPATAPRIAGLAAKYGEATQFFGEVHPSEANYVALLGGDTFGIHDDDGFYCHAGMTDPACHGAAAEGYADHTATTEHLGHQLEAVGRTWKGYYENLPSAGSLAVTAGDPAYPDPTGKNAYYASKHSGFLNFASVQHDPRRAEHIVGFDQLGADLASNRLPSFALVVPNQCNEMHGIHGPNLPPGCDSADPEALIRRGDRVVGDLVDKIQATAAWRSGDNFAIVITFDEGAGKTREGCCAVTPEAPSNFGGGHIPTIVITNHGPRGVRDDTAYNHYSLLRTVEDAFGISQYLGHAADTDKGVVPMVKLF